MWLNGGINCLATYQGVSSSNLSLSWVVFAECPKAAGKPSPRYSPQKFTRKIGWKCTEHATEWKMLCAKKKHKKSNAPNSLVSSNSPQLIELNSLTSRDCSRLIDLIVLSKSKKRKLRCKYTESRLSTYSVSVDNLLIKNIILLTMLIKISWPFFQKQKCYVLIISL